MCAQRLSLYCTPHHELASQMPQVGYSQPPGRLAAKGSPFIDSPQPRLQSLLSIPFLFGLISFALRIWEICNGPCNNINISRQRPGGEWDIPLGQNENENIEAGKSNRKFWPTRRLPFLEMH